MYNIDEIIAKVQAQMPNMRWEHTLGVVQAAIELAARYGVDEAQAELAAYLHDYTKYWPIAKQKQVMIEQQLSEELLAYDPQLWHAPVGAFVVKRDLGITDEAVLDAIRYHTSGRVGMTKLEKVVCLADYIERGRSFPGVETVRELAKQSLDAALIAGFDTTIRFLLDNQKKIYPLTVMTRNDLLNMKKEGVDVNR